MARQAEGQFQCEWRSCDAIWCSKSADLCLLAQKFLLDRRGLPVSHYGKKQEPLSFEDDIARLLKASADPVRYA